MPPNNPMTEGEALAVLRGLVLRVLASHKTEMEGYSYFSSNPGVPKDSYSEVADEIAAAIAAHTAASGGEVACHRWWRNGELVDSDWTNGPPSERQIEAQRQCRDIADWTVEYAYRAPPAAVPADALERLAASMESAWRPNCCCSDTAKSCADELAALIPKGAV